jgi:hypothetical protein
MTVDERDCVVCRVQRGEREADSTHEETIFFDGEETPVTVSNVTVDYVDEWGYSKQHTLCSYHQRMTDLGRTIHVCHPPTEEGATAPELTKRGGMDE